MATLWLSENQVKEEEMGAKYESQVKVLMTGYLPVTRRNKA